VVVLGHPADVDQPFRRRNAGVQATLHRPVNLERAVADPPEEGIEGVHDEDVVLGADNVPEDVVLIDEHAGKRYPAPAAVEAADVPPGVPGVVAEVVAGGLYGLGHGGEPPDDFDGLHAVLPDLPRPSPSWFLSGGVGIPTGRRHFYRTPGKGSSPKNKRPPGVTRGPCSGKGSSALLRHLVGVEGVYPGVNRPDRSLGPEARNLHRPLLVPQEHRFRREADLLSQPLHLSGCRCCRCRCRPLVGEGHH